MELDFEISERKLEDIVASRLKNYGNGIFDGQEYTHVYRQFNFDPYGIADIVAFTEATPGGRSCADIFELKKGRITLGTLSQAMRYKKAMDIYIESTGAFISTGRIYLVGGSMDSDLNNFIGEGSNISVFTYDIDENGIFFHDCDCGTVELASIPLKSNKFLTCPDYESHDLNCQYYHHLKKNLSASESEIRGLFYGF